MAFTAGHGIIHLSLGTGVLRKSMASVYKMVGKFQGRLSKLSGAFGGMGTKLAGAAGLGAAVMAFGKFEQGMSKVKALTGATGASFAAMEAQAKKLGATTTFSARAAADGMSFLAMAGYDANQIVAAMPATLNLAAAGAMDLAAAADISTNIMSAFQLRAEDTSRAVDVLAAAASSSNTDVMQLGEAVKYAGDIARTTGLRLEDTVASMMAMANVGIRGSMAGTSFAMSLAQIQKKAKDGALSVGKMKVQVMDAEGALLPMPTLVDNLNAAMAGLGKAEKVKALMDLVGSRGLKALGPLLATGGDKLREMTTELDNSQGRAAEMAKTMQENFFGSLTRVKSALEGVAISLGESMAPGLNKVAGWLQNILPSIQAFVEQNKGMIAKVIGVTVALGALLVLGPTIIGMFGGLVAAIGLVVSPIGLLIAGLGLVAKYFWDTRLAGDSFGEKLSSLKGIVIGWWSSLKPIWEKFKTGVIWSFVAIKVAARDWKLSLRLALISTTYGALKFVDTIKHLFTTGLGHVLNWLADNWKNIFRDMYRSFEAYVQNVMINMWNLWEAIKGFATGEGWRFTWTPLLEGFEAATEKFPDIMEGMMEGELTQRMGKLTADLGAEMAGNIADEFKKYTMEAPTIAKDMDEQTKEGGEALSKGARDVNAAAGGLADAATKVATAGGSVVGLTQAMAGIQTAALKQEAASADELVQLTKAQLSLLQRADKRDEQYQKARRRDEKAKGAFNDTYTLRQNRTVTRTS